MLCLGVESILTDLDLEMISVHDLWLSEQGIALDAYLDQVQLVGSDTDGLFIWCASKWLNQRITVASMAGLWSSIETGDGEEVSLVFTENGFHCLLISTSQYEENLVYPLQPPSAEWSLSPPLLQAPVCDLDDMRK